MNILLFGTLILIFFLFLASVIIFIQPELLVNCLSGWPARVGQRLRKSLPAIMFAQEDMLKELEEGLNESQKHSRKLGLYRVSAAILALGSGFFLILFLVVSLK